MSPSVSRPDVDRRTSRGTAAVTGAAVFAVCLAYAGWSLFAGRSEESGLSETGIALGEAEPHAPNLLPGADTLPGSETTPVARLSLDDGTEPALPVLNAHHEVEGDGTTELAPAFQQLGFETRLAGSKPDGAVGAWLTGGIEPAATAKP